MTEAAIQRSIVDYLRRVMPDAIVHHSRNEINKRGKAFAREIANAKRLGAVPGFPDLIVIPYASAGICFFEVKAPRQYPTKTQKAVHAHLERLGHRVAVVRSIDDVRDRLEAWGIGFREAAA